MAATEPVGGGPEPDGDAGEVVRPGHTCQAVAHVPGPAARIDITKTHEHIRVRQGRAEPGVGAYLTDDLDVIIERWRGVGEDVGASLDGVVVHPPAFSHHAYPADGGRRIRRVVPVSVGLGYVG